MCLIGDFVLTDNEGLKLQATGCLLEKRLEKERAFDYNYYKKDTMCRSRVYNVSLHERIEICTFIVLAILWESVILWPILHIPFFPPQTLPDKTM